MEPEFQPGALVKILIAAFVKTRWREDTWGPWCSDHKINKDIVFALVISSEECGNPRMYDCLVKVICEGQLVDFGVIKKLDLMKTWYPT